MHGGEGACEKNEERSNEMCVVERVHVKRMKEEE